MVLSQPEEQIVDNFQAHPDQFNQLSEKLKEFSICNCFARKDDPKTPYPAYIVPLFLDAQKVAAAYGGCKLVAKALVKIRQAYYEDEGLQKFIGLPKGEQELLEIDRWVKGVGNLRFDAFISEAGDIKFVEANSDYPDATIIFTKLSEYYKTLPHLDFVRDRIKEEKGSDQLILDSMLSQYKQNGFERQPVIGLFSPPERWWICELINSNKFFKNTGFETYDLDPLNLKFQDGKLMGGENPITMVRRNTELFYIKDHQEKLKLFLEVYRSKQFLMYNSFQDRLLGYKTLFAVLYNHRWDHLFTDQEKAAIACFIPQTMRLEKDGKLCIESQQVDARGFLLEHKNDYVIKPAGLREGKSIFIGASHNEKEWRKIVEKVVAEGKNGGGWVVQKKVELGVREVLRREEGRLNIRKVYYDVLFYLFGKDDTFTTGPMFSRASTSEVVNLSRGGVVYPVFLL